MLKVIIALLLSILPVICMGNIDNNNNTVKTTTFLDTIYSRELPPIEFKLETYHNFGGATTVGYKIMLRGAELDINGALFYKEDPEADDTVNPLQLLSPFHVHVGDSTDKHRIDHVYITHKFPFNAHFFEDDSIVIFTNKGNFTLYASEDKRAAVKYKPIIDSLNDELAETEHNLEKTRNRNYVIIGCILAICLIIGLGVFLYFKRFKRLQTAQMDKLLALISENEMSNRQLKAKITDLMRNNFNTINQLCYEYFEKADTNFLRKSIYTRVEQEIENLKSPDQLSRLEKTLNTCCDNIITKVSEQLPALTDVERTLLIYLYSGLSARTICILTDIQLKNFYMRRLRLKSKIMASDAPDKEWFVSLM